MPAHNGSHRSKRQSANFPVLRWLQVGAVTAGVSVALTASPGVAAAESTEAAATGSTTADVGSSSANNPRTRSGPRAVPRPDATATMPGNRSTASTNPAEISEETAGARRSVNVRPGSTPRVNGSVTTRAAANSSVRPANIASEAPHYSPIVTDPAGDLAPAAMSAAIAHATQTVAPVTIAAIGPTTTAAWSVNPLVTRLGLPYPAQITAPVTTRSIITDMLGWIGLGALNPRVPGPAMPVSDFVAGVWVGIRRIHYTLWNSHPTLSLTTATTDPVKAVVTGNLGGADVDGDVLTYAVSNPSKGTVEIAEDGTYTYTPDAEFAHTGGTDSFVASVSDTANPWHRYGLAGVVHHLVRQLAWAGVMNPDTKIVRVTVPVGFVNAAPIVEAASVGAASPSTGAVLGTVATSDADGDTVTFTTKTAPLRGAVQLNSATGAFTYTPNPVARHAASAQGAAADALIDTFTLEIADGYGGTTLVPVTVAIAPANANPVAAAPTIGNPNVTTGAVAGALSITDADGDAATYPAAVSTDKGTAVIAANGTFVYTPNANARHAAAADAATAAERTDTFTVTISDGHGGTTAAVVTVAVAPSNTNPVAGTPTIATADAATGAIAGSLAATDADGDTTAFVAITAPSRGTLSLNQSTGAFTYTPDASARHAAAADGATGTDIADTFTLAVTDGYGGTTLVPVTVSILPANTAPVAAAPTVGEPNATTGVVAGALVVTDADDDTLTYALGEGPTNGTVTVDPDTGAYVYTPNADARHALTAESGSPGGGSGSAPGLFAGRFGVSQFFDVARSGGCSQAGSSCTVSNFKTPYIAPYTNREILTWSAGDYIQFVDTGTEAVGLPNISLVQFDSNGVQKRVVSTNGYVQTLGDGILYIGEPSIGGGTGYFISNTLGIEPNSESYSFATTTLDPTLTELNSYAASSSPLAPGETPISGPADEDSFTVVVSDGHGGTYTQRVTVPITPANAAPTAVAGVGEPDVDGTIVGTLAVTDTDGDTTAVAAVTAPTRGTLTVDPATGAFTYTPDPSARHAAAADDASAADLTDAFTLGVTDGHGGTIAVPISVTIDPANTDPTGGTPVLGDPDAAGTIIGRLAGTDADGDTLIYRGSGTSASGAFVINPDGSFTYTPTADALAAAGSGTTDSFTITIDDGHGGVVAVPVTVTITAGNSSSPGTPPAGCPTNCQGATVTFTGGTAYFDGGPGTTNGTGLFRSVDYYVENGFIFDYVGGSGGDVGDYYGTGNDVIHGHWGSGDMTSIEIRKDGGGPFNFNYFVLTSNTLAPGGPAQGTEQVFIQGFLNGTAPGPQVLLPPEDWGLPASSVFAGTAFDSVDKVVITSTNGRFSCFGMDSFFIDPISV